MTCPQKSSFNETVSSYKFKGGCSREYIQRSSLGSKSCRMNFLKSPCLAPVVEGELRSCDLCLLSSLSREPLPEIVGCVFTSCICQSHLDSRKGFLCPLGLPVGLKRVYSVTPQTCFGEIVSSCLFCLHCWPPEFLC